MDEMVYLLGFYGLLILIFWIMTMRGTAEVQPDKHRTKHFWISHFLGYAAIGAGFSFMYDAPLIYGLAGGAIAGLIILGPLFLYQPRDLAKILYFR